LDDCNCIYHYDSSALEAHQGLYLDGVWYSTADPLSAFWTAAAGPIPPNAPVLPGVGLGIHLCKRHFCGGNANGVFYQRYSNMPSIMALVTYAVQHGNGYSAATPNVVYQVARYPVDVGTWNGVDTNVFTVSLFGRATDNGTTWIVSNIFPGLPPGF
jgi:hypothetical protein